MKNQILQNLVDILTELDDLLNDEIYHVEDAKAGDLFEINDCPGIYLMLVFDEGTEQYNFMYINGEHIGQTDRLDWFDTPQELFDTYENIEEQFTPLVIDYDA